jgi:hypothetical protein
MYGETAFLFRGMSEETHRKILEAGHEEVYAPGRPPRHRRRAGLTCQRRDG